MPGFTRALRLLDEVQHLAEVESFDPSLFIAALGDATPAPGPILTEVGSQLDGPRGLFAEIDRFAQKIMRIRLHHVTDALPPKLSILFSSTIVAYEGDLTLLRARVGSMLGRHDGSSAARLTDQVCAAAERVLALRSTLRRGVAEMVRLAARGQTIEAAGFDERPAKSTPPVDGADGPEPEADPTARRFSLVEVD